MGTRIYQVSAAKLRWGMWAMFALGVAFGFVVNSFVGLL